MATAILIDGGFFLKRFRSLYPDKDPHDPHEVAKPIFTMAIAHLRDPDNGKQKRDLYRIFFYDCPPIQKKAHLPISGNAIDFAKTPTAKFRLTLHDELKRLRKCALRLGHLSEEARWAVKPEVMTALLSKARTSESLRDEDFFYHAPQKGVDMRIGLDISSLAHKKQVDQIVLVAGDSDFVPAAKLARREGIDFVLDPLWAHIHPHLFEHIDGLHSTSPKPFSDKAHRDPSAK